MQSMSDGFRLLDRDTIDLVTSLRDMAEGDANKPASDAVKGQSNGISASFISTIFGDYTGVQGSGNRLIIGTIAALVTGVFTFLVAKGWGEYQNACEDLEVAKNLKGRISCYKINIPELQDQPAAIAKLNSLADISEKFLARKMNSELMSTVFKVVVLAGAVFALVGAIAAEPVVMAMGAGIGGVGCLLLLAKLGAEWNDRRNQKEQKEIVEHANGLLNGFTPTMQAEGS